MCVVMRLPWFVLLQMVTPAVSVQLPPVPTENKAGSLPQPQLFAAVRAHDLGKVNEGDKATVHWLLENRGNADLVIERTQSSCGCAVVKMTEKQPVIPPGGSLDLQVEFDSRGRRGQQAKSVTVYSNDSMEPALKLEFAADVQVLFEIQPPGIVNLHALRRGTSSTKTIDVHPGTGRKSVTVVDVQVPENSPLRFRYEPFPSGDGTGQRIYVTASEAAELGTVMGEATIKLSVDGIERERTVTLRGEIVGDLTWRPKVLDATGQASLRGKQLAPVTVESGNHLPFNILEASAGPLFDVTTSPGSDPPRGTKHLVVLTLRGDASSGPFGAMLNIRTDVLDQPIVRVPVYGIVSEPIEVDPPVVLLRQDGTDIGAHRRVKLQVIPQLKLSVSEITCDNAAVVAAIDQEAGASYQHICFLDVRLARKLPEGTHNAALTVATSIEGAQRLVIPVTIDVPRQGG
jgi:hypothetical protein